MARVALGYQKITSLVSATALTVPDGTKFAVVIAESQSVRWRDDGTSPTGTTGMLLPVNTEHVFDEGQVNVVEFIETAASAALHISYYG